MPTISLLRRDIAVSTVSIYEIDSYLATSPEPKLDDNEKSSGSGTVTAYVVCLIGCAVVSVYRYRVVSGGCRDNPAHRHGCAHAGVPPDGVHIDGTTENRRWPFATLGDTACMKMSRVTANHMHPAPSPSPSRQQTNYQAQERRLMKETFKEK